MELAWVSQCVSVSKVKRLKGAILGNRDSSVVMGTLASYHCGLGSIPGLGHMKVEFVVSSYPCMKGFSLGLPVFNPP